MRQNKYLGPIGLTELINLIQADFQKKQDWMQFPEMPDAALYTGKVVQYTGITDPLTYTKGFFYYSNGLEWTMVNVASAVEVCAVLPMWDEAKDGTIYYVTSESACYIKGSVPNEWLNIAGGDNKSFEIVATLPAYDAADPKIIYMVVDDDYTVTGYIKSGTAGRFYQLGGGSVSGFKVVTALPDWSTADTNLLYLVPDGKYVIGYVKNPNELNEFWQLGSDALAPFEVVATLPAWSTAKADKIYFVKTPGKKELKGFVKNEDEGGWNKFGQPTVIIQKYPDSEHYDPDAVYPDEGTEVDVSELEIIAFKDREIKDLYDEV